MIKLPPITDISNLLTVECMLENDLLTGMNCIVCSGVWYRKV